jgi:hypothetical protein
LAFLIRNGARPNHPVIGIIGLANAVIHLHARDVWIGWTPESVYARATHEVDYWPVFRDHAVAALECAKNSIRLEDLLKTLRKSKSIHDVVSRLKDLSHQQARLRQIHLRSAATANAESGRNLTRRLPVKKDGTTDWKAVSELPLFKRKRAETLAEVLQALDALERAPSDTAAFLALAETHGSALRWKDGVFEKALGIALREIKKAGVATRILDVNVCGAAPTYRALLGGKLAALSLFSREVQNAYQTQYESSTSEIASAMAGRPVVRSSHICILTTTSLYGVGSSQYNRVRFHTDSHTYQWQRVGETGGYGTLHLSKSTIEALRTLTIEERGVRNVNNQFGEGSSPLLRQCREGLDLLGFESNDVLHHSDKRLIYGAELYPKARDDLTFAVDRYRPGPTMDELSDYWLERWLAMRIANPIVQREIATVNAESVRTELDLAIST